MPESFELMLASDFTARSDRPLDRALDLVSRWNGTLVIAHVVEKGDGAIAAEQIERLRSDLPDAARDAELVVRTGSAPRVLAEIASERRSDLIVTGVARYDSLGDYVVGSTVTNIIRHVEAPVLVVRRRTKGPYRRLLATTDLSDCSRTALLAATRLFPEAEVTVVHAWHVPFEGWLSSDEVKQHVRLEARKGLDAFLDHPDVPAELRLRVKDLAEEGDVGSVVTRLLRQSGIELLVVGTHGRGGFAHATIGSQAEALLKAADADVLMVRGRKE